MNSTFLEPPPRRRVLRTPPGRSEGRAEEVELPRRRPVLEEALADDADATKRRARADAEKDMRDILSNRPA